MRFDVPHECDRPRRREPHVASDRSSEADLPLPKSPLDSRLDLLRSPDEPRKYMEKSKVAEEKSQHQMSERASISRSTREPEVRPRRTREGVAIEIGNVRLRLEERQLLLEAGRFRVLASKDVAETIYHGDQRAMKSDLEYLRDKGLINIDSVTPRNDGRWLTRPRIEVVTLTKLGHRTAHQVGDVSPNQKLYHRLVKPREAEHDTQIYRAYLKESEKIEKAGGRNLRVELDFELKSKVQKAIHAAQKQQPERNITDIKREVAQQFDLPYVRDKIEIPDARVHYEIDQGARTASSDIEVVTAAYRPAHMRAKEQAGFRLYASSSDRSRLGKVEDEQHLLDWVMDL